MKKLILSLTGVLALSATAAFAQTSSTTTTTSTTQADGSTVSKTTTTENTGTITEWTPGTSFVLRTEAAEPVHYRFSKTVSYVTPDGQVVEASKVTKNSKVRVHYVKEGNDMMVDKVIVLP